MRLIDADKLYKYLDDVEYTCDKYAEVEDILEIIKNQPTVNAIKISPNLTNKGFIKKKHFQTWNLITNVMVLFTDMKKVTP